MSSSIEYPRNNAEMVEYLKDKGYLDDPLVEEVMLRVDRANYCKTDPYLDEPQKIGHYRTTSAPQDHAHVLLQLKDYLVEGATVLDVGSGCGYLTAMMALMVGEDGLVIGVEDDLEIIEESLVNIEKDQPGLIDSGRIKIIQGDIMKGCPEEGPFDAIHVSVGVPKIPDVLIKQLKSGGRMVVNAGVDNFHRVLAKINSFEDDTIKPQDHRKPLKGVAYVYYD